tara:strand:- start:138 stop:305 length:168 start_codon:yes stop_codon:yes gene_type:complete
MSDFLYAIDNILTQEECKKYIKLFDNPSNVEKINDKHRKYGCWIQNIVLILKNGI